MLQSSQVLSRPKEGGDYFVYFSGRRLSFRRWGHHSPQSFALRLILWFSTQSVTQKSRICDFDDTATLER